MTYEFREPVPVSAGGFRSDPVGVIEIAQRLGVLDRSVHKMIQRGRLPAPDYDTVNGSRAWEWRTILWWAGETRRLNLEAARDEYRQVFKVEPPVPRKRIPKGASFRPDPTPKRPAVPSR